MEKEITIFISHSHHDSDMAELFVNFITSSIRIDGTEIICSSLPGHLLEPGQNISKLLKDNIDLSPVLIALITKNSLASNWVLTELSSAWALDKLIIPIIGYGLSYEDLPPFLRDINSIIIADDNAPSKLKDVISLISKKLNKNEKSGGQSIHHLNKFLSVFSEDRIPLILDDHERKLLKKGNRLLFAINYEDEIIYQKLESKGFVRKNNAPVIVLSLLTIVFALYTTTLPYENPIAFVSHAAFILISGIAIGMILYFFRKKLLLIQLTTKGKGLFNNT